MIRDSVSYFNHNQLMTMADDWWHMGDAMTYMAESYAVHEYLEYRRDVNTTKRL